MSRLAAIANTMIFDLSVVFIPLLSVKMHDIIFESSPSDMFSVDTFVEFYIPTYSSIMIYVPLVEICAGNNTRYVRKIIAIQRTYFFRHNIVL